MNTARLEYLLRQVELQQQHMRNAAARGYTRFAEYHRVAALSFAEAAAKERALIAAPSS